MKIKPHEFLRWVLAPLLAGCLLAWLVTPAYPAKALDAKAPAQATSPKITVPADTQEVRKLIDELQARERENYAIVLEGQRKTMDWWFGFLAIVTAVLAVFGALIPYLMGRKDRELIAQDKALVEQDKGQIEKMLSDAKIALDEAKATVAQIHQHETDAKQRNDEIAEILNKFQSGQPDGMAEKIKEAVDAVQNDPTSDTILRLRAEAIAASEAEQADKAYALWRALTELDPTDAIAHFNAGYWAHGLGEKSQGSESLRWLRQAGQHYSQGLSIEPANHVVAYNWGVALYAEARIIAASDLNAARKLWQQAGEKYRQALDIKSDDHDSASNWGLTLASEAEAIAASDLDAARKLWQQAGEKYRQALDIKSDDHETANNWGNAILREASALAPTDSAQARSLRDRAEQILLQHAEAAPGEVAYNLACVYGVRGDTASCLHWLKTCQLHNTLEDCKHLRTDADLNPVRTAPEFIEWLHTVCPQDQ